MAFNDFLNAKKQYIFTSANNKKAMSKPKTFTFIMSDESVNCYGFRILTNGIDTDTAFAKNPVAFWNHRSDDKWKDDYDMPVAKWLSWKKENGKLIGELQVDDSDDLGKKLISKIEGGYINAVSIYFDPVEVSDAPEHLQAGQTRSTITRCILLECSLVGLPGNMNAVKLKNKNGGSIALNSESKPSEIDNAIPLITIKNSNMTVEQKKLLGLSADATDQEVEQALKALKQKADAQPKDAVETAPAQTALSNSDKTELENLKKERITTLLNQGVADKKFAEEDKPYWEKLANADFDSAKSAIAKMQSTVKLSNLLGGKSGNSTTSTAKTVDECEFVKLGKTNPSELNRIKKEEPEAFAEMQKEYLSLLRTKK